MFEILSLIVGALGMPHMGRRAREVKPIGGGHGRALPASRPLKKRKRKNPMRGLAVPREGIAGDRHVVGPRDGRAAGHSARREAAARKLRAQIAAQDPDRVNPVQLAKDAQGGVR